MNTHSGDQDHSSNAARKQWDGVAAGWARWWRTIERGAEPISRRMLDLAEVAPGQRILDIATGIGEPALSAAKRAGPSGQVVGTDLSPEMLALAQQRAVREGCSNVEFMAVDASQLPFSPGSFDTILCRWGITALPGYADILKVLHRLLRPGGAFVSAVWSDSPRSRPLATLAAAVMQELLDGPPAPAIASSAQDSVGTALRQDLLHAGFSRIHMEDQTLMLTFASPDECAEYLWDVSPELARLLSRLSSAQQATFGRRLAQRLEPFQAPNGQVVITNVTLCAAGRA
jgi:ubiquinone/menaquinone biosynthesis C-methylase UbiE